MHADTLKTLGLDTLKNTSTCNSITQLSQNYHVRTFSCMSIFYVIKR